MVKLGAWHLPHRMDMTSHREERINLGEKLREAIDSGLLDPAALARECGVSRQAVYGWLKTGRVAKEHLTVFARLSGKPLEWWLGDAAGNGGTHDNSATAYNHPTEGDNFEAGPDLKPRPYPEISWVQAGMWTEIADNFEPGPDQAWHYATTDLGPHGFVVRVKGYSMTAPAGVSQSFPQGTLLFVNPDAEPMPGKFVIVRRNGNEATFKKLILVDGELYLEALNPDWPNRFAKVHPGDRFSGVVREARIEL